MNRGGARDYKYGARVTDQAQALSDIATWRQKMQKSGYHNVDLLLTVVHREMFNHSYAADDIARLHAMLSQIVRNARD